MQFTTFVSLASLLSLPVSFVFAAPVDVEPFEEFHDLESRTLGTQANPFIIDIDCSGPIETCEAQCTAILCFGSPQVLYVLQLALPNPIYDKQITNES